MRKPEEVYDLDPVAEAQVIARVQADWRFKAVEYGRFVLWALLYAAGIHGVKVHWPLSRTGALVLGLAACGLYTVTRQVDWRLWTPFCRWLIRVHRRAGAAPLPDGSGR